MPDLDKPKRLSRVPTGTGAVTIGIAAACLVTAGLIALREPVAPSRYVVGVRPQAANGAARINLSRELARCRTVTDASADPDCHAAWDAHRRRFFGSRTATKAQEH